ncbi:MAG: class I SAM-dependent methyltransferase, partial [Pacificimonas sp.]
LIDYRAVKGTFDSIVSVGMFEHVGKRHYPEFFEQTRRLLSDDGVMLLHTIGRMGGPGKTDAFTDRYIFPGGYNPALSEIVAASEPHRMIMSDCETLRVHYAHTIHHWYDRCVAAKDKLVEMYDERFYRMWIFYLAGAETVFRHGGMCNYQLQYVRDRRALPLSRDYMAAAETIYLAADGLAPV